MTDTKTWLIVDVQQGAGPALTDARRTGRSNLKVKAQGSLGQGRKRHGLSEQREVIMGLWYRTGWQTKPQSILCPTVELFVSNLAENCTNL